MMGGVPLVAKLSWFRLGNKMALPSIRVRKRGTGTFIGAHYYPQGIWVEVSIDFWKAHRLRSAELDLEWDVPIPDLPLNSLFGMRVVVPYANRAPYILRPETVERLAGVAEFVNVYESGAYWNLMVQLLTEKRSFCVVEHDMVPELSWLGELDACPRDWCGIPFPDNYMKGASGCCRYSAELLARLPNLPDSMEAIALTHLLPEHYKILLEDGHAIPHHHYSIATGMLDRALNNEGVECHAHDHVLIHLREFP
jgi:hypothetical protein